MTAAAAPAGLATARDPAAGSAGADGMRSNAPVVVLTSGHAGAQRLQGLLEGQPELACTTATGLLAACDQAATAWRQAERRPSGALSPLARASIRSLAATVITTITVRAGRPRWCEIAAAERTAAETFLTLFPNAKFICLYRACPDVAFAVLSTSPWGLSGPAFAAYTAAHPASTVAALAAWWAGRAAPMLAFEQAHPGECLRVRYEDLVGDPDRAERVVRAFLSLSERAVAVPAPPAELDPGPSGAQAPGCGADLPAAQIPPALLAQVNTLHAELGYPPLQAAT